MRGGRGEKQKPLQLLSVVAVRLQPTYAREVLRGGPVGLAAAREQVC